MHHDQGSGARARSARIRSSHDYEATQLDTMRRNTQAVAEPEQRGLASRITSAFGHLRRPHTATAENEAQLPARAGLGE